MKVMLKNYAKALLDHAQRNKIEPQIDAQLEAMFSTIMGNQELRDVLASKAMSKTVKIRILENAMKQCKFDNVLIRFFTLLIEHNRISMLDKVYEQYQHLARVSSGREQVKVYYARNIADKDKDDITTIIKQELCCSKLEVAFVSDANLIAGFVVCHNSIRMNYSVAGIIEHYLAPTY